MPPFSPNNGLQCGLFKKKLRVTGLKLKKSKLKRTQLKVSISVKKTKKQHSEPSGIFVLFLLPTLTASVLAVFFLKN